MVKTLDRRQIGREKQGRRAYDFSFKPDHGVKEGGHCHSGVVTKRKLYIPNSTPKIKKMKHSHTLDDKIVSDSLIATTRMDSGILRFVGGGMAAQSYLSKGLYRTTGDLDLTTGNQLNAEDFRTITDPLVDQLRSVGYTVEYGKKAHQTHDLVVVSPDGKESLKIQLPRQSPKHFFEHKGRVDREMDNACYQTYHLAEGDASLKTIRPEDLILRKLARVLIFEEEWGLSPIPKQSHIYGQLEYVNRLKEDFDPLDAQPRDVAELRMQADLFDVNALLDKTSFDKKYFEEGIGFYEILAKNKQRTEDVARAIHWKFGETA